METTLNTVQVVSLLVGTVLPVLVGLVTYKDLRIGRFDPRPVLLLLLSAASAVLTEFLNVNDRGEDFNWGAACVTALATFVTAVAVHYGFWKPMGVAEKAQLTLVKNPSAASTTGRRRAA